MWEMKRIDESSFYIFINEVTEDMEFYLIERIDWSPWGSCSFILVYFEVI